MSVVAEAEQVYTVEVEMADGTRTVVQVRGDTAGEAYRQARDTPGVRRVGRVTAGSRGPEGSRGNSAARSGNNPVRPGVASAHRQASPEAPASPAHRGQLLGLAISGPRLVRETRAPGGERPFAHLQPPPPRPEPIHPPKPVKVAVAQPAVVTAQVAVSASAPATTVTRQPATAGTVPTQPATSTTPALGDREYRIVKSRRKDGLPYLLQRGTWGQVGTKRVFASTWEKGFDAREKAEAHQAWAERMAAEIAEFNRDLAESSDE